MTAPVCPCGEAHSGEAWDYAVQMVERFGETVPVRVLHTQTNKRTAIRVPRVYIAMHGIAAAELKTLAAKYGWEESEQRYLKGEGHD